MKDKTGGPAAIWATVLIGLFLPGCAALSAPDLSFDSAGRGHEQVAIRYRVDAQRRRLPVAVTRIEGQLVSYETRSEEIEANNSLGVLEITYPHPRGRVGYSLARVTIGEDVSGGRTLGGKSGWIGLVGVGKNTPSGPGHESWELDIAKTETDQLIARLQESQFFGPSEYSNSGVRLTTNFDGEKTTKSWNQIPEFDALVQRVRHDGLLVSYRRNEDTAAEDKPKLGLARFVRPFLGVDTDSAVPTGYVNETPGQHRAGSRFAPGGVRTSLARVPKKQPAPARLRRLPAVDPVFTR